MTTSAGTIHSMVCKVGGYACVAETISGSLRDHQGRLAAAPRQRTVRGLAPHAVGVTRPQEARQEWPGRF